MSPPLTAGIPKPHGIEQFDPLAAQMEKKSLINPQFVGFSHGTTTGVDPNWVNPLVNTSTSYTMTSAPVGGQSYRAASLTPKGRGPI